MPILKTFIYLLAVTLLMSSGLSHAQVVIREFLAANDSGIRDDFGDREDWIEIQNVSDSEVDLDGWMLSDDEDLPQKWTFPALSLPTGARLVVFASGRDRRDPAGVLHTNFSLSKGGEYLALTRPDGTKTTEFAPEYPVQADDVSYGVSEELEFVDVISTGHDVRVGVPRSAGEFTAQFTAWQSDISGSFSGSRWRSAQLGLGYETDPGGGPYGSLIGANGNVENDMLDINASIYVRAKFTIDDVSEVSALYAFMRWDDGFVVYINGQQVAVDRAPTDLPWDARATGNRPDGLNDEQNFFFFANAPLVNGENLLAIHGLNAQSSSSDFLLDIDMNLIRSAAAGTDFGYLLNPSPGGTNGTNTDKLAPIFAEVTTEPMQQPKGDDTDPPLVLTAEVRDGSHDLESVEARVRIMFDAEVTYTMLDDGQGADLAAGDGIFTTSVDTSDLGDGDMLRWRYIATDENGEQRLSPAYLDPLDSDQYFGTVVIDDAANRSDLPVMQTFVPDEDAVDTVGGGRVSVYYLGQFYDNVQMDLHGQSTASFPKKSYDLDFNRGNRFRWQDGEDRVKDINLLTNWADKSKTRNTLIYGLLRDAGSPTHYAFPVRVERNGDFFSVADMVEDGDDRYLDRVGLDGDGALYKMYTPVSDPAAASKKTRKEESTADLVELLNWLNPSNGETSRRRNAYDHLDVAATVNHLVANQVIGITDTGHKNFYLYRDTEGSGEWQPLPWDVDLSAGRRWNPDDTYFDDTMRTGFLAWNSNDLWQLIYETPEFREMFVRRFETMRRDLMQARTVPAAQDEMRARVFAIERSTNDPDVFSDSDRDYLKWGSWGNQLRSFPASQRIYDEWLPAHRNVIFNSNLNVRGVRIPSQQSSSPDVRITSVEPRPESGNQDEEYIVIRNFHPTSLDLSGWTLDGAVDYTFPAGTVILAGTGSAGSGYKGLIHVVRDAAAFRARSTGPTGGQFRYVQGGYDGQLSARGETVTLRNADGAFVSELSYAADPSPAQMALRVTELNYHPEDPRADELAVMPQLIDTDFEYIELTNIGTSTLELEGVYFSEGIDYTFPAGATLSAGGRLLLAKNPAAFALRYGDGGRVVFGPYLGQLSNGGESLKLRDAAGENVLDIDYSDDWYPTSDGGGASLVLRDESVDYDLYDNVETWGASRDDDGSPGVAGQGWLTHFNAWAEVRYTEAQREEGEIGHAASDEDGDGLLTWMEYALGTDPSVADQFDMAMTMVTRGEESYMQLTTQRRIGLSDYEIVLESGTSLSFTQQTNAVESAANLDAEREMATFEDPNAVGDATRKFYRLRLQPK